MSVVLNSTRVLTSVPPSEWDAFLKSMPDGHHLQTSLWAGVKEKEGWNAERLVAVNEGRIVVGLQLFHQKVPGGVRVGYVPRGPVLPEHDDALIQALMDPLLQTSGNLHIGYLAVQPPKAGAEFEEALRQRGFLTSPTDSAPTATILIDVQQPDDALLGAMRKSVRRSVRRGLESGLQVRVAGRTDLPAFHALMQGTAERQGFTTWTLEHLQTVWQQFAVSDDIVLLLAEKDGVPVAGELEITFGDTLISKRSGWSGEFAKDHPNELLIWRALQWARERGLKYYDMEGFDRKLALDIQAGKEIPEEDRGNHHWFKFGFGGQVVVLPQNYELVRLPVLGWAHRSLWGRFLTLETRRKLMKRGHELIRPSGALGLIPTRINRLCGRIRLFESPPPIPTFTPVIHPLRPLGTGSHATRNSLSKVSGQMPGRASLQKKSSSDSRCRGVELVHGRLNAAAIPGKNPA